MQHDWLLKNNGSKERSQLLFGSDCQIYNMNILDDIVGDINTNKSESLLGIQCLAINKYWEDTWVLLLNIQQDRVFEAWNFTG